VRKEREGRGDLFGEQEVETEREAREEEEEEESGDHCVGDIPAGGIGIGD
jgi:hypothetical protein